MNKFKAGNTVQIAKSSKYYGPDADSTNPKDIHGEVIDAEHVGLDNHTVKVQWDNELSNVYRESDLELVKSKPEFKIGHGAICIKKTYEHNVGDVLLISGLDVKNRLKFNGIRTVWNTKFFTPCPNPPRTHYKERIAYALDADIEFAVDGQVWTKQGKPNWLGELKYRVAIPDIHAEKREQLQAEIERLQSELDSLGGDL